MLCKDLAIKDAIRFRDDNPELFGVQVGEGMCDETYMRGLRDHLCNSVELVPELFPEITRAIAEVKQQILPHENVRAFISSDPTPQAWCMSGQKGQTMILGLTSGLVGLLSHEELKFVIGHEIGHYIMGHHRRVVPESDGVEGINFRSLQRMAEISADRVGFLACPDNDAAFRAMLKTASGLGESQIRFDIAAFTGQFERLKDLRERDESAGYDAWSTHPMFTVRCRALSLFGKSAPYYVAAGKAGRPELSQDELEDQIAADLYDSTGYHPMAEIERAVRISLIWMVLRLFIEDCRFTKSEQAFLLENFDHHLAAKGIEFVRENGPVAVCKKYEEAMEELASMSESARNSACAVVRRVASVAGGTEKARLKLLREMHKKLKCRAKAHIESWADEQTLGGLLELRGN